MKNKINFITLLVVLTCIAWALCAICSGILLGDSIVSRLFMVRYAKPIDTEYYKAEEVFDEEAMEFHFSYDNKTYVMNRLTHQYDIISRVYDESGMYYEDMVYAKYENGQLIVKRYIYDQDGVREMEKVEKRRHLCKRILCISFYCGITFLLLLILLLVINRKENSEGENECEKVDDEQDNT